MARITDSEAQSALEQIDDVLTTNWIVVKDNDYRKALNDLIGFNVQIALDPAVNGGSIVLTAEEREHVSKLLAGYLVGPAAVPAIRKIRGY